MRKNSIHLTKGKKNGDMRRKDMQGIMDGKGRDPRKLGIIDLYTLYITKEQKGEKVERANKEKISNYYPDIHE